MTLREQECETPNVTPHVCGVNPGSIGRIAHGFARFSPDSARFRRIPSDLARSRPPFGSRPIASDGRPGAF